MNRILTITVFALSLSACGGDGDKSDIPTSADDGGADAVVGDGQPGDTQTDAVSNQDARADVAEDVGAEDAADAALEASEEAEAASPLGVGSACQAGDPCPEGGSGEAVCIDSWPGGYCAVSGCAEHGHDCPGDPGLGVTATEGSKCVLAPEPTCLALCGSAADCRPGYDCISKQDAAGHGSVKVCAP